MLISHQVAIAPCTDCIQVRFLPPDVRERTHKNLLVVLFLLYNFSFRL